MQTQIDPRCLKGVTPRLIHYKHHYRGCCMLSYIGGNGGGNDRHVDTCLTHSSKTGHFNLLNQHIVVLYILICVLHISTTEKADLLALLHTQYFRLFQQPVSGKRYHNF